MREEVNRYTDMWYAIGIHHTVIDRFRVKGDTYEYIIKMDKSGIEYGPLKDAIKFTWNQAMTLCEPRIFQFIIPISDIDT